jgi:hypothetical protein
MKNRIFFLLAAMALCLPATALAGDCTVRDKIDGQATITSGVFLRADCPSGDIVGTVPAGERVELLEVDRYGEFYLVKTSVGTGFLFESFLKDIDMTGKEETYSNSVFVDLNPQHKYYAQIADLKAKGIISGNPEGKIMADSPVNRAELAKILVEANVEDEEIAEARLGAGIYSDVDLQAWYSPYLHIAREKGILTGDGAGSGLTTVRPAGYANGAEVTKMLVTAFELPIEYGEGASWYAPYWNTLQKMNILPYQKANHQVSRGEMFYMISKILE